jgi:hypothetical protein
MKRFVNAILLQLLILSGTTTALVPLKAFHVSSQRQRQTKTKTLHLCPDDGEHLVTAFNEALNEALASKEIENKHQQTQVQAEYQNEADCAVPMTSRGIFQRIRTSVGAAVSKLSREQ